MASKPPSIDEVNDLSYEQFVSPDNWRIRGPSHQSPQRNIEQQVYSNSRQAEQNELDSLNEAYKQKFGFPFVICARENKVAAIIAGLKSRQNHGAEEEVTEAIGQVCRIAWYRLANLASDSSGAAKL
eukprot:Em0023g221a